METHEERSTNGAEGAGGPCPLDGVRILDLTQVAAGPYGTSMMGDLGADVIKVEPLGGDSLRSMDDGFGEGQSAYFFGVNRSKRAIALDLKSAEGQEVLRRLVEDVDVFVVAFRPSALTKLGIDYETLRAINPRLIYVSITAFGDKGPRAEQPGMDILAQALSGLMGVTGEVGGGPVKVGAPIADFITSYLLGFGVTAALRLRDRTGVGERLSISLLDGLLSAFANYATPVDRMGLEVTRQGGAHPQIAPYQPFLDADGKHFILACLNDKFWRLLLPILDEFEDFRDARFDTNTGRVLHREELSSRLQSIFAKQSSSYWLEQFEAAGVPCGPINDLEAALRDPQVLANEAVTHLNHPLHGEYLVLNNPIRFREAPTGPRGFAPSLGQHTAEVLAEIGYSEEEIAALAERGAARLGDVR